MRRRWRWGVVAVGIALLVALPFAVQSLPAGTSAVGAAKLLERIRSSSGIAYSGYARSTGGLALPTGTGPFAASDLLGGATQLRVWWRTTRDWRVDAIVATGETDLHHDSAGTWTWDYESGNAERRNAPTDAVVRLPRADDLVPGNLARRLMNQARDSQISRLPDARIAGEQAAGLRLRVHDGRSTITHVDVWALPGNGLPLRVAVYGADRAPIVSTTMFDVSTAPPAAKTTAFRPADGVQLRDERFGDIVAAIDQFGRSTPPATVAGFGRRPDLRLGAIGVYGRGVTLLVAVPLSARLAGSVVPQLRKTPGAVEDATGIAVGLGPLNLQLSPPTGFGARWLLVGTVSAKSLRAAVPSLPPVRGFGFER